MAIPGTVPASMARRLLAFVIDAVAALLVGGAFVGASLLPVLGSGGDPEELDRAVAGLTGPFALLGYALVAVLALVQWWALGTRGWTIGKRLVQLRAVSPETGRPVGMGRALLRFLVPAAGSLALGVGQLIVYLSPFWDAGGRRQGWHDKAAGTMVFDIGIGLDPTLMTPPGGEVSRRLDGLMRTGTSVEGSRLGIEQPSPALPPVSGSTAGGHAALSTGVPISAGAPLATDAPVPADDRADGAGPDPVDTASPADADPEATPTAGGSRPPRPVFPSTLRNTSADDDRDPPRTAGTSAPRPVFPSMRRTAPVGGEDGIDPGAAEVQPDPVDSPEPSNGSGTVGASERTDVPGVFAQTGAPEQVRAPERTDTPAPVPPAMTPPDAVARPGMISTVPWLHPRDADDSEAEPDGSDTDPAPSAPTASGPISPDGSSTEQDPPPLPDLPDEVEQTRLRPARGRVPEVSGPVPPSATLLMSDGRRVEFRGLALIGRDPTPRPGEDPDLLVRVTDPGRSVSKTHLAVGTDRSGVWVADRDSTNGTVVTLADGQQILCGADQEVRLPEDGSVAFGDYGFTVELLEDL